MVSGASHDIEQSLQIFLQQTWYKKNQEDCINISVDYAASRRDNSPSSRSEQCRDAYRSRVENINVQSFCSVVHELN